MTLVKMIKDVIEDGDTAKQITNKICKKYRGYFAKRVDYYNNDVKKTRGQINAEVSSQMGKTDGFDVIREHGQLNKYSATHVIYHKPKSKRVSKDQKDLLSRVEKLEKDIPYLISAESSLHGTINYNYVPNSFELSGFASNGSLLSKKEWGYLLSKKAWKKLAKALYLYRDDLDRFFLYVPPGKVKDVSQSCEMSSYFKVVKEEIHFYKCKDNNGWTDFLPLADEALGIFHKLTINLSPKTKIKFARIYDYKLVGLGILLSTFIQLIIS